MSIEKQVDINVVVNHVAGKVTPPDLAPFKTGADDAQAIMDGMAKRAAAATTQTANATAQQIGDMMKRAAAAASGSVPQKVAYTKELRNSLDKQSQEYKYLTAVITIAVSAYEKEAAAIRKRNEAAEKTKAIFVSERLGAYNRQKAEDTAAAEREAAALQKDDRERRRQTYLRMQQDLKNETAQSRFQQIALSERGAGFERQRSQDSTKEATRQLQAQEAAVMRTGAAMRTLGETTALTIRGFVLLGSTNQKEAEKIMRHLLMVQGSIDVYKGLIGTLTGVTKAYQAITAAAAAAAAAQAASAAAGAAGGAAGAARAGSGAMAAGAAGSGLVGAAAGAIGAAGLILGPIALGAAIGLGSYAYITGKANDAVDRQNAMRDERRDDLDRARRARTRELNALAANQQFRANQKLAVDARERGFALSESDVASSQAQAAVGRTRTNADRIAAQEAADKARAGTRGLLVQQGGQIAGELAAAQAARQAALARTADVEANRLHEGKDFEAERKAAREQQKAAEEQIVAALGRQMDNRRQLLQSQRESIELAKEQLQAEKDRVAATNRGLGHLNAGQQQEVARIAAKVKGGGTLTEQELRFLEQNAGGATAEFTGRERERLGADFASKFDLSAITGGPSQVGKLEDALRKLQAGADTGVTVEKILEQLADDKQREAKALENLADTLKNIGDLANSIDRIREDLEGILQREARRNALES